MIFFFVCFIIFFFLVFIINLVIVSLVWRDLVGNMIIMVIKFMFEVMFFVLWWLVVVLNGNGMLVLYIVLMYLFGEYKCRLEVRVLMIVNG